MGVGVVCGCGVGVGLHEEFKSMTKAARHIVARKVVGIVVKAVLTSLAMNLWGLLQLPLDGLIFSS
jgi:hypothetical protein